VDELIRIPQQRRRSRYWISLPMRSMIGFGVA
jgi:hypothetical protein